MRARKSPSRDFWLFWGGQSVSELGTAFTLLYAFVGIPLGRLSDRAPRKTILALAVFVWSALTGGSRTRAWKSRWSRAT